MPIAILNANVKVFYKELKKKRSQLYPKLQLQLKLAAFEYCLKKLTTIHSRPAFL